MFELTEGFLWLAPPASEAFSIQVGRQLFEDDREWLYEEELDAVRVWYRRHRLAVEFSVSRNGLVRKDLLSDEARERINNYVLSARYEVKEDLDVGAYVIFRDDRKPTRERPFFIGLRSRGEILENLDHWLELGHVRGRDGSKRVRGWGVDLGATYEFDLPLKPSLTLGYAFGSGDADPDDQADRRFRQTGLHDNEADFGGVASFKYYGELFDPELSNLSVFTVGVGARPSERSSLDLVWHYYLQHHASDEIGGTALDAEPSGRRNGLGNEVDLVAGYEQLRDRVDLKLILGYFLPGPAFGDGADPSFFLTAEVQIRF